MNKTSLIFPASFHYETPMREMNFLGAVKRYFESINIDNNENTKYEYFRTYKNIIFPAINPGIPVKEYSDRMINNLIESLQSQRYLLDSTIRSNYRHLIIDPFKEYQKEFGNTVYNTIDWGSEYSFHNETNEEKDSTLLMIPKSFHYEENKKAFRYFLACAQSDGEIFGLAIMYFIGSRENEICGLNFSDFVEFKNHPGCFYVISGYGTTGANSNTLETGGKTRNSSKRVPVSDEVRDLIKKRMEYIEKQIGRSCLNLPMVCRGQKFEVRCSTNDLSKAGRNFFKNIMNMRENDMAGISIEMKELANTPFEEKDPTTYFLRRNFATRIGNYMDEDNGLTLADCQYLLSHDIEDENFNRYDYNDEETLYKIYLIINKYMNL